MHAGDGWGESVKLAHASRNEPGSWGDRKPEVVRSWAEIYSVIPFSPVLLNENEKNWRIEFVMVLFDGGRARGDNDNSDNNKLFLFYARY